MENQIEAWLKEDIMVGFSNKPEMTFQSKEVE